MSLFVTSEKSRRDIKFAQNKECLKNVDIRVFWSKD